jgi:signal transduction histidine kinase
MKRNKLLKLTITLLITISVLIVSALCLFIYLLHHQSDDSQDIMVASRQRMLSQRITKTCLLLTHNTDSLKKVGYRNLLSRSLEELKSNNTYLIGLQNSEKAATYLNKAQPLYQNIVGIAEKFIAPEVTDPLMQTEALMTYELSFFELMDNVVEQFVNENQTEIARFKYFIIFSNVAIILILFSLVMLVINPAIIQNEKNTEIIRQKNAELSRLNSTKNKLFSVIAHDLRNPFNYILGYLEMMLTNIHEQKIEEIEVNLNNLRIQSENTYHLLENLLDWAKTQTGQIGFHPVSLDIKSIIDQVVIFLKPLADNKNVSIEVSANEGLLLYADPDMLKTILRNLITNAIKYSNLSSVIHVYLETKSAYYEISVEDKGIGMREDEKENLFQGTDFISKNGTAEEKGSGLGLMICKEFVERHSGKIRVESETGKGSKFIFSIPVHNTGELIQ